MGLKTVRYMFHTCNSSSISFTESSLAAARAENKRHPAARARPVLREGSKETIGVGRRSAIDRRVKKNSFLTTTNGA